MEIVKIGDQEWMTENLNTDYYQNGDKIPEIKDAREWELLKTGAWCNYKNDPANGNKYGKLYNWYAVNDPRGLAPAGWHIPKNTEFLTLETRVNLDGNALKAIGQATKWTKGYNRSGFSSLMSGHRSYNGSFHDLCSSSYFWSSTEFGPESANSINLYIDEDANIYKIPYDKTFGFSIRCLKDQVPVYSLKNTGMSYEHIINWEAGIGGEKLNIDSNRNGGIISVQGSF
ncbi:MAG: fibrobacter succinogenes major paralogous domain-containing protein [Ignavibacteriaceae bacterium]|nr:fibrobacter succinogenes major paralogous domain-containing protein [Ignavibacteriaceae bacterium]